MPGGPGPAKCPSGRRDRDSVAGMSQLHVDVARSPAVHGDRGGHGRIPDGDHGVASGVQIGEGVGTVAARWSWCPPRCRPRPPASPVHRPGLGGRRPLARHPPADHDGDPRLFRTDRALSVAVLDQPARRRAGLELTDVWQTLRRRIDDIPAPSPSPPASATRSWPGSSASTKPTSRPPSRPSRPPNPKASRAGRRSNYASAPWWPPRYSSPSAPTPKSSPPKTSARRWPAEPPQPPLSTPPARTPDKTAEARGRPPPLSDQHGTHSIASRQQPPSPTPHRTTVVRGDRTLASSPVVVTWPRGWSAPGPLRKLALFSGARGVWGSGRMGLWS